jgi:Major Vault Protein repeat domain
MDEFEGVEAHDQKQAKAAFGTHEIRTYEQFSEPFPLYPGEEMIGKIMPYQTVP